MGLEYSYCYKKRDLLLFSAVILLSVLPVIHVGFWVTALQLFCFSGEVLLAFGLFLFVSFGLEAYVTYCLETLHSAPLDHAVQPKMNNNKKAAICNDYQ